MSCLPRTTTLCAVIRHTRRDKHKRKNPTMVTRHRRPEVHAFSIERLSRVGYIASDSIPIVEIHCCLGVGEWVLDARESVSIMYYTASESERSASSHATPRVEVSHTPALRKANRVERPVGSGRLLRRVYCVEPVRRAMRPYPTRYYARPAPPCAARSVSRAGWPLLRHRFRKVVQFSRENRFIDRTARHGRPTTSVRIWCNERQPRLPWCGSRSWRCRAGQRRRGVK